MTIAPPISSPLGDTRLLIAGERLAGAEDAVFPSYNPATGEVLVEVAEARAEDVDRAVRAARRAFVEGDWPRLRPADRAQLLWRLGDLLLEHAEELGALETLDNGKPYLQARDGDVAAAAGLFHYMSGWVTKHEGSTLPISAPGTFHTYTRHEPIGVVGLIVPWNFPLAITAWKVAPALATGNTVVLKPAEQTPLTALRLGELALEAGLPPGVLNVVPGFGSVAGAALVSHEDVDKVSFTGSTATGRAIAAAATGNLKKVSLELGGKSPDIIFADADVGAAIDGAAAGIFSNQGEACVAGARLYVHSSVYDEVLEGVSAVARGLRVGDGFDPATEIGPLVSAEHLERVSGYVESGKSEGAVVHAGGEYGSSGGYYVQPTVFAEAREEMRIVKEEIFGPVVAVLRFDGTDEVIERANATRYGLAAGVWTGSIETAHKVAAELRAGTVWVNCYGVFDPAMPFGGYKESGWGREMGHAVLAEYSETKTVCVRLGD